mgnify:CR=1 FL=1
MSKSKITFAIQNKGLLLNKSLHPQPMQKFMPDWYKNIKADIVDKNVKYVNKRKTAKTCPSFVEIFKEGYVILSPQDYVIKIKSDGSFEWRSPLNFEPDTGHPSVHYHSFEQFHKYYDSNKVLSVVKLNLPIQIIAPKGYSVRQMHMPYTSKEDYEITYGVLKADKIHACNVQIMFYKEGEYVIHQGQPLAVYVPFKREEFDYEVVDANDPKYYNKLEKDYFIHFGKIKINKTNYYKE